MTSCTQPMIPFLWKKRNSKSFSSCNTPYPEMTNLSQQSYHRMLHSQYKNDLGTQEIHPGRSYHDGIAHQQSRVFGSRQPWKGNDTYDWILLQHSPLHHTQNLLQSKHSSKSISLKMKWLNWMPEPNSTMNRMTKSSMMLMMIHSMTKNPMFHCLNYFLLRSDMELEPCAWPPTPLESNQCNAWQSPTQTSPEDVNQQNRQPSPQICTGQHG